MLPGVIDKMKNLAKKQPRFKLLSNLTKGEYYTELASARIQFNSSLQDYVSWTVLESTTFGCDLVFPNFRSFPEFIPESKMYKPFNVQSALKTLQNVIHEGAFHGTDFNFADIADLGRRMEGYIISNRYTSEINVWHESELCEHLIKQEGIQ